MGVACSMSCFPIPQAKSVGTTLLGSRGVAAADAKGGAEILPKGLFSGFGLASVEQGNDPDAFAPYFGEGVKEGRILCPHCGEEFAPSAQGVLQSVANIGKCLDCGAQRIGHAVCLGHILAEPNEEVEKAQKSMRKALRERNIVVETCPLSNLCIKSTHVSGDFTHLASLFEDGVRVALCTDDANCWEPGTVGGCMEEQRKIISKVFSPACVKAMARTSIEYMPQMPAAAKNRALMKVDALADEEILWCPSCDLHAHFAGSWRNDKMDQVYQNVTLPGKARGLSQAFLAPPELRHFCEKDGKFVCENAWENLAAFSEQTYKHQLGIILSDGISRIMHKIIDIADDCKTKNIVGIVLQMPIPQGCSNSWTLFYGASMKVAQQAAQLEGTYVAFATAYVRNINAAAAKGVDAFMQRLDTAFGENHSFVAAVSRRWAALEAVKLKVAMPSRHPARLPKLENLLDVALVICAFGLDAIEENAVDRAVLIEKVTGGLMGFKEEKNAVKYLKPENPFRVGADFLFTDDPYAVHLLDATTDDMIALVMDSVDHLMMLTGPVDAHMMRPA